MRFWLALARLYDSHDRHVVTKVTVPSALYAPLPPAYRFRTNPTDAPLNNSTPKCATCGESLTIQNGRVSIEFVDDESARCARWREIAQQRQALAARIQAGIAGMLGTETMDTVDKVAQRQSLTQLDATLKTEAEELERVMGHIPRGA